MPLDIATTLCVRDRRTDSPASLVDIARIVGEWAELDTDAMEPGEWSDVGRDGADVRIEQLDPGPGEEWAWRLALSHPDRTDPTIRWEVEVEATEPAEGAVGEETLVAVALSRTSSDSRVRQVLTERPAPPRVIKDLIRAHDLECMDGPIPLTVGANELVRDGVDGFVTQTLLEADRGLPVIGVTVRASSGEPILDQRKLANALAGMAHVWLVPPDATWSLEAALPARLGVYNGAVRIWWPGLDATSRPFDHHLWLADGGDPRREVFDVISRSALARHRPLGAIQRLRRAAREVERRRIDAEFEQLRRTLEASPTSDEAAAVGAAAMKALEDQLAYLNEYRQVQDDEIEGLKQQLRERDEQLDKERNTSRSLSAQLEGLQRAAPRTSVEDAPTTAFLDEMRAVYERRYRGDDKRDWSIGDCRLHPRFLAAVDVLSGVSRDKVLEVCVDVATGRVHQLAGRDTHQLRAGDGAGSRPRLRVRDGAGAWRCALQKNTPQARRLHWWSIPGGAVEFAHVGLHDDMRCPE